MIGFEFLNVPRDADHARHGVQTAAVKVSYSIAYWRIILCQQILPTYSAFSWPDAARLASGTSLPADEAERSAPACTTAAGGSKS